MVVSGMAKALVVLSTTTTLSWLNTNTAFAHFMKKFKILKVFSSHVLGSGLTTNRNLLRD